MDRFGREAWTAIVAASASLAILVTPGVQSWYAAIPLWVLTAFAALQWVRAARATGPAEEAELLSATPDDVRKPYRELTSLQASSIFDASFRGKRIRVTGTVVDVSKYGNALSSMRYAVGLSEGGEGVSSITLWFPDSRGGDVAHLQHGTPLTATGKVTEATRLSLVLMDCRIMP